MKIIVFVLSETYKCHSNDLSLSIELQRFIMKISQAVDYFSYLDQISRESIHEKFLIQCCWIPQLLFFYLVHTERETSDNDVSWSGGTTRRTVIVN